MFCKCNNCIFHEYVITISKDIEIKDNEENVDNKDTKDAEDDKVDPEVKKDGTA